MPWLTNEEAAARMRISSQYLRRLRSQGKGPPFSKLGARVIYGRSSVDEWLAARGDGGRSPPSDTLQQ